MRFRRTATTPLLALARHAIALDQVSVEGDPRSAGRYMITRAGEGRLGLGTIRLDPAVWSLEEHVLTLQHFGVCRCDGGTPALAASFREAVAVSPPLTSEPRADYFSSYL